MTDKATDKTAQAAPQELLQKVLADNNLTITGLFLVTDTGDVITLPRALKPDYTGAEWKISIVADYGKNGNA